jgi:hypothetical protein
MKNLKRYLACLTLILGVYTEGSFAQVAVNTDGSAAGTNTMLDLNPAIGKAFVPPKMTWAQIKAISPASEGMMVYDTEFKTLRMYNGSKWVSLTPTPNLYAPPGNFITQTGIGTAYPFSVVTDASGNVYMAGGFSGTATFNPYTITSAGAEDIFVAKYNSTGVVQWVRRAGGSTYDEAFGIALDPSGNVFVTGRYSGTANFGGFNTTNLNGSTVELFLVKYDNMGNEQWVRNFGNNYAYGVGTDGLGNIYVTGGFTSTANFGGTMITSNGNLDIFIVKFDINGNVLWVQKAGGTSSEIGFSIAVNGAGDVYICGSFLTTASFNTSPIATIQTSAGQQDIFIAKYNNSGICQWAKRAGGPNFDESSGIAIDGMGNAYIVGEFFGTANFGLNSVNSTTSPNSFIAKYNSSGVEQWVRGTTGSGCKSRHIVIDATGNAYVTGHFFNQTTFGTLPILNSAGVEDVFIAKYNSSGLEQWVQRAGGTGNDRGFSITVDALGNVYTVGFYTPSAQFGNQLLTTGTSFLMKYSE